MLPLFPDKIQKYTQVGNCVDKLMLQLKKQATWPICGQKWNFGLYKIFSAGIFGKMLMNIPIPWKEITFSYYGSLSRKQSIMKKENNYCLHSPTLINQSYHFLTGETETIVSYLLCHIMSYGSYLRSGMIYISQNNMLICWKVDTNIQCC